MLRSALIFGVFVLTATSVRADQVHLSEGAVLEGKATVIGDKVVVELESGRITVPLREVAKIDRAATPLSEATAREAALRPNDLTGLLALANFCREHDLLNKERDLLTRVVALAPEHAEARRRLGFVRTTVDGKEAWVDRAELARREQSVALERRQARVALEQKQAELSAAEAKLQHERLRGREERQEPRDRRYELRSYYGSPAYYAGYGMAPYGFGAPPALSPPSGPPPFPIPGVRSPSDMSFNMPGVRPPAAYFEGALRRNGP